MKKKNKKNNDGFDWKLALMLFGIMVCLAGLTITTASSKNWSPFEVLIQYFVPAFIAVSLVIGVGGLIAIGLEKRRRKVLRRR